MNRELFFAEVLARAKEIFGCRKDVELANILGISAQVLGNRKKTHSVPYDEIIAVAMERGADVQYILTGIRSSAALTPDEQMLLAGYRTLDARGKAGVFGVIGGLTQSPASVGQQFNGTVGQVVHGDIANNKFKVKPEEK